MPFYLVCITSYTLRMLTHVVVENKSIDVIFHPSNDDKSKRKPFMISTSNKFSCLSHEFILAILFNQSSREGRGDFPITIMMTLVIMHQKVYLAAYSATRPRRKGTVIPTIPAIAMGIFSASDILSVFLSVSRKNVLIFVLLKKNVSQRNGKNLRCKVILRLILPSQNLWFVIASKESHA